jgi:cytochrome c553
MSVIQAGAAVAAEPQAMLTDEEIENKNASCLFCHDGILKVKTQRKDIVNLHKRHYKSDTTVYNFENRMCVTCHAAVTPARDTAAQREGYFNAGKEFHPNCMVAKNRKLIVRPAPSAKSAEPFLVRAFSPKDPYLFKPSLASLVCVRCHGPDSKIKTLYGTRLFSPAAVE